MPRKPKPTADKRRRGNPGKRKLPESEPQFETAIPDPPSYLTDAALVEWTRVTEELAAKNVITRVDMAVVAIYCQAQADLDELEKESRKPEYKRYLKTKGKDYVYKHPIFADVKDLREQVRKYAAELGITPSSRTKVRTLAPVRPADPKKDMAESLFRAKVKK